MSFVNKDAHLQFGNYAGYDLIGTAYIKECVIWFSFSFDEGGTWMEPESVQTVTDPAEDPDMIFINHAGGLTEDFIVIWVQGSGLITTASPGWGISLRTERICRPQFINNTKDAANPGRPAV